MSEIFVHFFVCPDGKVCVNHKNLNECQIKEDYDIDKDYQLIDFIYNANENKIYITNYSESYILKKLEDYRENNEKSDEASQLLKVYDFFKNRMDWDGEIIFKNPFKIQILEKNIEDFDLACNFLNLLYYDKYNVSLNSLPILICDCRSNIYLKTNEFVELNDKRYQGPLIILNKNNDIYKLNYNIVKMYLENIDDIEFEEFGSKEYLKMNVKSYLDNEWENYLETGDINGVKKWYAFVNDNLDIKIRKNISDSSRKNLVKKLEKEVITFRTYEDNSNACVIVVEDLSISDFNLISFSKDLYNYLFNNYEKIELSSKPIFLFEEENKNRYEIIDIKDIIPVWSFIKIFLSSEYNFVPVNIEVVKGNFNSSFRAHYYDKNESNNNYPKKAIWWNEKYLKEECYLSFFHSLIEQYLVFIKKEYSIDIDTNLLKNKDFFNNLHNKLTGDENKVLELESEILMIIESTSYFGDYDLFKFIFEIVNFNKSNIENFLYDDKKQSINENKLNDILNIYIKIFYIYMNALSKIFEIKFKLDIEKNDHDKIIEGSIVKCNNNNHFSNNILKVEEIYSKNAFISENNPYGRLMICEDLVNEKRYKISQENLYIFELKKYISQNLNKKAYNIGLQEWEVYEKIFRKYLKNPEMAETENDSELDGQNPSTQSLLQQQNEAYEREHKLNEEGEHLVYENLLNSNRYGE